MRVRLAAATAVLLLSTAVSHASAQSVGRMLESDFKGLGGDLWAVWTSPFDGSGQDWLLAAGLIAGSHAIMPLDDNIDRWAVRDSANAVFNALKPFRKDGLLFQGNKVVPFAGAALIFGYVTKNQGLRDGLYGCAGSWFANNIARHQVFYRFVRRERPDPYKDKEINSDPAEEGDQYKFGLSWGDTSWAHNSWPGGHVANFAACASFLNHRFNTGYAEPVLWALVAGVGVGRIADRAHWTSDQVLGVILGYAIGREVAHRQKKREERRRLERNTGTTPIPTSSQSGFYLVNHPTLGMGIGWQRDF